mgnify:CR=1 FL=1
MERNHSRVKSFHFAFSGLNHALYTQKNFQIQVLIAFLVLALAWVLDFSRWEWIILVILIGLVLTAELLNTVIEVVVDLAVKEQMLPDAKVAKDVAAASVLLMSFVSVFGGILLFWPHLSFLFE